MLPPLKLTRTHALLRPTLTPWTRLPLAVLSPRDGYVWRALGLLLPDKGCIQQRHTLGAAPWERTAAPSSQTLRHLWTRESRVVLSPAKEPHILMKEAPPASRWQSRTTASVVWCFGATAR